MSLARTMETRARSLVRVLELPSTLSSPLAHARAESHLLIQIRSFVKFKFITAFACREAVQSAGW